MDDTMANVKLPLRRNLPSRWVSIEMSPPFQRKETRGSHVEPPKVLVLFVLTGCLQLLMSWVDLSVSVPASRLSKRHDLPLNFRPSVVYGMYMVFIICECCFQQPNLGKIVIH